MGVFGGDFAVGRQAPPGTTVFSSVFAIEPRPESPVLVLINDAWTPIAMKILNTAGTAWIDPAA